MFFADYLFGLVFRCLIFTFKGVARFWRTRRGIRWPTATATVVGASYVEGWFSSHVVEVVYTYRIEGGFYGGADERTFLQKTSAESYLEKFPRGSNLVVRVKPGQPEVSLLLNEQQPSSRNKHTSAPA